MQREYHGGMVPSDRPSPSASGPLADPPFGVKKPSLLERICWCVPLLGWFFAAQMEMRRRQPKRDHLLAQLAGRSESALDAWGTDPQRRQVAAVVCEEMRKEFAWPHARFLPDDPFLLLCWSTEIDASVLEVFAEIESSLGIHRIGHLDVGAMTLGQVVDHILAVPPPPTPPAAAQV